MESHVLVNIFLKYIPAYNFNLDRHARKHKYMKITYQ